MTLHALRHGRPIRNRPRRARVCLAKLGGRFRIGRTDPKFEGTDSYVATDDLKMAVNAAVTLERPLLIKGEPGTGKTLLAEEIAAALGRPLIQWHIKSTTKAQHGPLRIRRGLAPARFAARRRKVQDIGNYIVGPALGGFDSEEQAVLLIDEIDKADIEFPNDLLRELDRMEFYVYETREMVKARHRPIIIITSNNEKELPDAFLRRCFFHYIRFPDKETMERSSTCTSRAQAGAAVARRSKRSSRYARCRG